MCQTGDMLIVSKSEPPREEGGKVERREKSAQKYQKKNLPYFL